MIRAQHFVPNKRLLQPRAQLRRDQAVIDSPANIPGAHTGHWTQPCVMPASGFELAKAVEKSGFHERAKASAFFERKSMTSNVRFGVSEIELSVRDVEVAAKNHGLPPLQLA